MDHIDIVLQAVGNTAIPHWDGEQVPVRGNEPASDLNNLIPSCLLRRGMLLAQHHVDFCGCLVAVERGEVYIPQGKDIDVQVWILLAQGGEYVSAISIDFDCIPRGEAWIKSKLLMTRLLEL